jgi:hypothetical protein
VLSMFARLGFDWPPAITAIFNVFSLLNFNFELLAPECSLSVNYEAKWFVSTHARPQGMSVDRGVGPDGCDKITVEAGTWWRPPVL